LLHLINAIFISILPPLPWRLAQSNPATLAVCAGSLYPLSALPTKESPALAPSFVFILVKFLTL